MRKSPTVSRSHQALKQLRKNAGGIMKAAKKVTLKK